MNFFLKKIKMGICFHCRGTGHILFGQIFRSACFYCLEDFFWNGKDGDEEKNQSEEF